MCPPPSVDKLGQIYVIRNMVNGKLYVGQTVEPLKSRWRKHCLPSSTCTLLKRAIAKYGREAFTIEALESGLTAEGMNERERFWIAHLSTLCPLGYNVFLGGEQPPNARHKKSVALKRALAKRAARGLPKGVTSLSEADVREIFRLANGGVSQKDIAALFAVDPSTVSHILRGKTWSHLGLVRVRPPKPPPKPKPQKIVTPEKRTSCLDLRARGLTYAAISKAVSLSENTVYGIWRRSGVERVWAPLTEEQVLQMVQKGVAGSSATELGREYGVSTSAVIQLLKRRFSLRLKRGRPGPKT